MFFFFVVIVFWVDVYRCRYLNVYIYMYIWNYDTGRYGWVTVAVHTL